MYNRLISVFLVATSALISWCVPAAGATGVDKFLDLDSEQLMREAERFENMAGCSDSAMICYAVVADRYDNNMDHREKELCASALMNMWTVSLFSHFDYPRLFDYLMRAEEIYGSLGYVPPRVYLNYGMLYQTFSEQTGSSEYREKAIDSHTKAMYLAIRDNDSFIADMAFTNIMTLAYKDGATDRIKREWQRYKKLNYKDNVVRQFNILFYNVIKRWKRNLQMRRYPFLKPWPS